MTQFKLISLTLYNAMSAKEQGYCACLQDGIIGNELPAKNPYIATKASHLQWARGWKKALKAIKHHTPENDNAC